MRIPQLLLMVLVPGVVVSACDRADTDENVRRARGEVRELASRAGEQLADGWVTAKIQAQYFADDDVKARHIGVSTRNGVVTLRGVVDNESVREEALSIARATDGVRQVEDLLMVKSPRAAAAATASTPGVVGTTGTIPTGVDGRIDDASITTKIQAKYFLDNAVKERRIEVTSQSGIVTLRGTVASDNERAQAKLLAWTTAGVERVDDALTVDPSLGAPLAATPEPSAAAPAPSATPSPSSAAVREDTALEDRVRSRLQGDAQATRATIDVSAKDGVLLLAGTAPNAATKQRALTVARQTDGVLQVVDRIRVGRR